MDFLSLIHSFLEPLPKLTSGYSLSNLCPVVLQARNFVDFSMTILDIPCTGFTWPGLKAIKIGNSFIFILLLMNVNFHLKWCTLVHSPKTFRSLWSFFAYVCLFIFFKIVSVKVGSSNSCLGTSEIKTSYQTTLPSFLEVNENKNNNDSNDSLTYTV